MPNNIKVDDVTDFVDQVNVVTRHSAKSNNDYKLLQIVLSNGYEIEIFPERAEMAILEMLLNGNNK